LTCFDVAKQQQGQSFKAQQLHVSRQWQVYLTQEILEVEQLMGDEDVGLELTADNVEKSLDEIRSVTDSTVTAWRAKQHFLRFSVQPHPAGMLRLTLIFDLHTA